MIGNNSYIKILGTMGLSIGIMVILFLSSEQQVHRNNAFTRRYPPHPIQKVYALDLGFNSYYIAGFETDALFLANHTAPRHLLQIDLASQDTAHIKIDFQGKNLPYRSLKIALFPPYFFVMDGSAPYVLKGTTKDWVAKPWIEDAGYFMKGIPIDSNVIFLSTIDSRDQMTALGLLKKTDQTALELYPDVLTPQIDGVFDVDGTIMFDPGSNTLGYSYFYRNEFLVLSPNLDSINTLKSIDTVTVAQIQLATDSRTQASQMKAPPLTVNKTATLFQNLALINSPRLGRNEPSHMLMEASIIDVYNWQKDLYAFSFYLYDEGSKVKEFRLYKHWLVALMGSTVAVYRLDPKFFSIPINPTDNPKEKTTGQ